MAFATATLLAALGILVGMLGCLELGRRIGLRLRAVEGDRADAAAGAIDGAIFALFGLLIAFTFSGAASRFDERRAQIVVEANAIGTAYLRVDLLPAETQAPVRALFRNYVRSRLATYRSLPDLQAARAEYDRSIALQSEIWRKAVAAARSTGSPAVLSLVVSALNDTFDIATSRLAAARTHVPREILALLIGMALTAALVVGYATSANQRRAWFRTSLFAIVITAAIFIILDLEYPRFGFVRIEAADVALDEVLQQME
jgi:hypothetical protein